MLLLFTLYDMVVLCLGAKCADAQAPNPKPNLCCKILVPVVKKLMGSTAADNAALQ